MRPRRLLTLVPAVLALVAPPLAFAAAYSDSGGEAAPGSLAGGTSAPEPAPMSQTAPAAEPAPAAESETATGEPTLPERISPPEPDGAPPVADAASPAAVLPAVSLRAVPDREIVRAAQTPVEPEPGARPGEEDPFVPTPEAPSQPEAKESPQTDEPTLPLSGASTASTFVWGALMIAAGIAGLAISRSAELAAAR